MVQLIDFDALPPTHAIAPSPTRLPRTWSKCAETERRLDFIDWLLHVVREPARLKGLRNDAVSGFLLTFESTFQILGHETSPVGGLDGWLGSKSVYDVLCRGLRTLRNLEAHIHSGALAAPSPHTAYSRFAGGTDGGNIVAWRLPELPLNTWQMLQGRGRKIAQAELSQWNALVDRTPAATLLRDSLVQLTAVVRAAEA
jgi:hypothetical protein